MKRSFFTAAGLVLSAFAVYSADIYVSPEGNDLNSGDKGEPKATLGSALRQAREMRRQALPGVASGVTIHMAPGNYSVYEPVFVRPEDSGSPESPTVITSDGGVAWLNGGVAVDGWKRQGKLLVADAPSFNGRPLDFRQLYVNGKKAVRARDVQDFEKMHRIIGNDPVNEILWVPAEAVKAIRKSPYAEMVLHEMWCVANLRIKSIEMHGDSAAVRFHNPESRIQFEHPWPRPMVTDNGHNSAFYLTNAKELLDTPGEWYHDIDTRKVYYYPYPGETVTDAVVPAVETLVNVEGTLDRPVENVKFENIGFEYTTWMRPSVMGHVPLQAGMYMTDGYKISPKMERYQNHKLDNQGWLGRPAAAVNVSGAKDIDFIGCRFKHLGSSGLDYEWGTEGGLVKGCLFRDIAGSGIVAGSFSPASLETHLPYDPSDGREVCSGLVISNNLITDVSNEDWGTLGIAAGYVKDIDIEHNEINDVSYSGISLGWGWTRTVNCMRNNRVHANLIHHYARHMYDVAGVYTLGSQPHSWVTENCVRDIYVPGYAHDPDHWFYLYTDEGSSFITVKDNWTEGEKYLKNANGPGNVWENNGPNVDPKIKENAGLTKEYQYLKTL
ncbi:right-handed parallel beta-helix repeat-containing protein [uncultured Duncaniella sp.]|uniref:right-handed parallel beta-helix repeat-containing protein n=1 Tax=uncultured Duncaniella sp. TaxID=2768039 RepID=UPI0025FC46B6|nr:right-handed parallel beta-helix repeat-containing protein [uncultured Duncaniella sp.]